MRRYVRKTSVIIAITVAFLVMAIVIVVNLFHSGIRFSSISSLHGEDYKDGRQKSWKLVDGYDNPVLTISVDRRYILSGQNDFSCEILWKGYGKCYASIEENVGLSQQQAIDKFREFDDVSIDMKPAATFDYADITVARDKKVEHYLILGDTDNSAQVRLYTDSIKEDKAEISEVTEDILSMLEWRS